MPVQKDKRPRPIDVRIERIEAKMNVVVPIVYQTRRVVRDEEIDRGEAGERLLDIVLLVEMVAGGLVFPGATKAADFQPVHINRPAMQIDNGAGKTSTAIVIALHRKNMRCPTSPRDIKDQRIGQVTAGNEDIHSHIRQSAKQGLIIGYHQ